MRQVQSLLKIIGKAELVDFYHSLLSYATVHGTKLPSLNEVLSLSSKESVEDEKVFDDKTDRILEAEAQKRVAEMRAKSVQ